MLRIAKSLLTILAVAIVAVGATGAYFTDQEIITGNSLSSGKIDVSLGGPNTGGIVIPVDTTQSFTGGMAPNVEMGPYQVSVYNKGWGQSTLPVKYRWTEKKVGGSDDMYSKLNVVARQGNCDWNPNLQPISYTGPLSGMEVYSTSPLNPNITRCTWFWFELDPTAGNDLQGANVQFDLVLDATQADNPGWDE